MRSQLGAILLCAGMASAQSGGFSAMPFAAQTRQELTGELNVSLDAIGNAQLLWRGSLLMQIELLVADEQGWIRPEGEHQLLQRHWPYFHLDSVQFWQRRDVGDESRATGFRVRSNRPMQAKESLIHAHGGVGSEVGRALRFARLPLADGYELAIFDPAGGALSLGPDGVWTFENRQGSSWMLAVAVAVDERVLVHDIGQALLGMRDRESLGEIEPPPLCERCRNPAIDRLSLRLFEGEESWELQATIDPGQLDLFHEMPLFTTLRIGFVPMRRYLVQEAASEASFRIPFDSSDVESLLRELAFASRQIALVNEAGEAFEIETVHVDLPELARPRDSESAGAEFPRLLSPSLVDASPNPFQESTWLRVTIPTTIEEAFELTDELRGKIDPRAQPPFGTHPRVRVRIYNVKGKLVRTLYDGRGETGEITLSWNGQDDAAQLVASGAYYLNLQIEEYAVTRRLTVLRP